MIRAILVDDEQHALNAIRDLLDDYEEIKVLEEFTSPQEALRRSRDLSYDIAFLDIEMPGLKGLELGEKLLEADPSKDVVFVTAYDAYAVEAFELHALDYLLKPVSPRRMRKTVQRLIAKYGAPEDPAEERNQAKVKVRSFNRFEIAAVEPGDGERNLPWRINKVRELLAYLFHYRGQPVHKGNIVEDLWPHMLPDRAMVNLHTCIYQIRKTLKRYDLHEQVQIVYMNDCYQLQARGMDSDVETFLEAEELLEGEMDEHAVKRLEEAAALYGKGYMEQDDFAWAYDAKSRLEKVYRRMLEKLAEFDMQRGRDQAAEERLCRLIELDPFQEDYHEQLLRLYAKAGDRTAMIRHYKQMTGLYEQELGLAPRPSTTALFKQLSGQL